MLPKEIPTGPFADEWKKSYEPIKNDLEEVDIALAISSAALAVKDESELVCQECRKCDEYVLTDELSAQ